MRAELSRQNDTRDHPGGAGDSCDVLSRLVGPRVSERLGQQLVIDNRPGAGGQLGLQLLAQAPPDGYTIACGQGGNMVIVPLAYSGVPYDTLKDFARSRWSPTFSAWSSIRACRSGTSKI